MSRRRNTRPIDRQRGHRLIGNEAIDKVRQLLPRFRSAMMITYGPDGQVHTRPMALQGDVSVFAGTLWFFAADRSRKVQESMDDRSVSCIFQHDDQNAYLHLTGTAAVLRDLSKMRELYTPLVKVWFPDGLDDPHLTLLRFQADHGGVLGQPWRRHSIGGGVRESGDRIPRQWRQLWRTAFVTALGALASASP